jgi:hypothetical protein
MSNDPRLDAALEKVFGSSKKPHWTETRSLSGMGQADGIEPGGSHQLDTASGTETSQAETDRDYQARKRKARFDAMSAAELAAYLRNRH